MAIKYGFFHSADGDRKYTAEDIGRYLHGIVSSGVYADTSDSLQVLADGTSMTVQVQPGRAMLNYHYMENDDVMELTLSAAGTMDRIDAIVAVLDMTNRVCDITVKEGTPATTPKRPTMTRNDATQEFMLAAVRVPKLATAVTQANITDTRGDASVCGWVSGIIDQVDTSTLFIQYQEAMQTAMAEWTAFFNSVSEDLGIISYIQEYRNLVTLEEDTDTVYIGIPDFDAATDVLFVNYRGLTYMEEDYTVHGTSDEAYVILTEARKAGDPVEFRVLKTEIGTASAAAVLAAADHEGTVLTDEGAPLVLE